MRACVRACKNEYLFIYLFQVYAKIREEGVASEITICGGRTRQRSVYVSETNEIDVMMLTSRDDTNPVYFVLKYDGESFD